MTRASLTVTTAELTGGKPAKLEGSLTLWPLLFAVPLPPPGTAAAALLTSSAPKTKRTGSASKSDEGTLIPGGTPATATIDADADPFGHIGGWCIGVAAVLTAAPARQTHPAVAEFERRLVLALATTAAELAPSTLGDPIDRNTDRSAERPPAGSALSRMAFGPTDIVVNQLAATNAAKRFDALTSLRRIARPHLHPIEQPPPRSIRRDPVNHSAITASALHARLIWPTGEAQRVDFVLRLLGAKRSTIGHMAGEYRVTATSAAAAAESTESAPLPKATS